MGSTEADMLDPLFFANSRAQIWYQDAYFNIWKFATDADPGKRQTRPVILNYSIMTRAYGTCFNKDSFIDFINQQGSDVFLIDWGKESPQRLDPGSTGRRPA